MASPYKTGKRSEALLAIPEIVELAKEVLHRETLAEADSLARMLIGNKSEVKVARQRLAILVAPPPKRPLYYCYHEIQHLPVWTRDTLRYLGDFIDLLVKQAAYEFILKQKHKGHRRVLTVPMGRAIEQLTPYVSSQLTKWLKRYNKLLYIPAKHDFSLPRNRVKHRFTSREVVLTAFVTIKLADRICALSDRAKLARNDQLPI